MFELFGVKIKNITIGDNYKRKDGEEITKIELVLGKSNQDAKNLLTKIGYRYYKAKNESAIYLGEWLRLHDKKTQEKIRTKKEIRQLHMDGKTPKEISQIIKNVSYRMINSRIYERKYDKTSLTKNDITPFDQWLKNTTKGLEGTGLLWQKIVDKKNIEIDDVRDLKTVENTHNFIANGFITHNCPIETPEGTSIGLRKNMALLASVSKGDVAEDKLKKSLENLGLKVMG